MQLYFYLVHLYQPNQFALRLALYLQAPSVEDAKLDAAALRILLQKHFQLLFDPSDPALLVESVNAKSFEALVAESVRLPNVKLMLPIPLPLRLYQINKPPTTLPLESLEAAVLAPGSQLPRYYL